MSPKLLVFFLVLGILALSVQAGWKKDESSESKESKSDESKSNSKSDESKSDSKSQEDCEEPPKLPPPKKCGPNEEWTNCGTACPPTCAKPNPGPCILKCVVGCQCKKGLLRNKWNECVEPCDC